MVTVEVFSEPVGPAVPVTTSILNNFRLFFTMTVLSTIVEQTNIYARQILGESVNKWVDVTEEEILAILGFTILMGINQLPSLYDYWRKDHVFRYSPIADRIPRDRFLEILRFLHFVNNDSLPTRTDPNFDRLGKIRPILEHVLEACKKNYRPHRYQSIDEAMVAFKGRSSMKQYMPKKPTKRGFKVWVRADSVNGYVSQFEVYTGKQGDTVEVGLGGSVVTRLTRALVGQHYHVYMDNFFSSIPLFKKLLTDNIYATGTLRTNRKMFPTDLLPLVKRGLPSRGDIDFRQDGNLSVIVWQDTKVVVIMSTAQDPSSTTTVRRKKGNGSVINVSCPNAVVDYNQHMGGVDRGDQYRRYYQVRMKSRKAYRYIFWFLFEICILNSFIIHRYSPCIAKNITSYLDFRVQLARALIGEYCSRKTRGRPLCTGIPPAKRVTVAHYPCKSKKGRCQYCKKRWTVWFCSQCDRRLCHTGLRDTDCHLHYHTDLGVM